MDLRIDFNLEQSFVYCQPLTSCVLFSQELYHVCFHFMSSWPKS